jgi:hypothetical protein
MIPSYSFHSEIFSFDPLSPPSRAKINISYRLIILAFATAIYKRVTFCSTQVLNVLFLKRKKMHDSGK